MGKTVSRSCVAPLTVMPLMYLLKLSKIKSWFVLPDSCKVLAGKGWQLAAGGGPHCALADVTSDKIKTVVQKNIKIR